MTKAIINNPLLSEKAYQLSEERRTYIFSIAKNVTSGEVSKAIEKYYKVKPTAVRIAKVRGKNQRSMRRGGRSMRHFKRTNIQKAYVTLAESDNLPIFAALEEASKKPEAKK